MRFIIAAALVAHGIAHLVGFIVPWQIVRLKEMPYRTTVLGDSVNVGAGGIRLLGVFWFLAAAAFVTAGIGAALETQWWVTVTLFSALISLVLSTISWPNLRVGVYIDILILAFLAVNAQLGWSL